MNASYWKAIALGAVVALVAALVVMPQFRAPVHAEDERAVLRHVVLFDLAENAPLAEIEAGAYQMAEDIEVIQHIEWGRNLDFNTRNDGYDFVLLVEFDSIEGLEIYGPHPDHDVFRDIIRPHIERIIVVDYWGKAN